MVDEEEGMESPGGGAGAVLAVITGANAVGFRFGETGALPVAVDMLESVLFPLIMCAGFSFFSFFSLIGGGWTGEGVGKGKAALLLSGRGIETDVGALTGREVPMGTAVR
jgi:hypothetical protein